MLTEILPIVENACSFKKGPSTIDHNCAVEELSAPRQSCELFSVAYTDPCKSRVAPDMSGAEILVGTFNTISITEPLGQRDDEGKDKIKFDDASVIKCPDTKCSSPSRRSALMIESSQKTQERKDAKKCRKTVIKKPLLDSVLLTLTRKRRSFLPKPARSSVWGSLGYITQFLEQNSAADVNQNGHTKLQKGRGGRRSGNRDKNHSRRSKGKGLASSGRIRLKIKLGNEEGKSCLTNMISAAGNGLSNYQETSIEVPKLTDRSKIKLKKEVPGFDGYHGCNGDAEKVVMSSNATHRDLCIASDLERPVNCEKSASVSAGNHQIIPSHTAAEELGVAVDNRCLDSGTSPDSEVINLIPDVQLRREVQGDYCDALISSQVRIAPGEATSLMGSQISRKKGKKKNKTPDADNFNVEDRFPVPDIINMTSALETGGQGEKMGDVFYSSEASISTSTANVSGNTSSCEGLSRGPVSSSRATDTGVTFENLKVEGGREEAFRLGSENPHTKTKDRKHLKSLKSRVSKSGSEVSDSPKNRRGNSCKQKGNTTKSYGRTKVKDTVACAEVLCKVENHPDTGDHSSLDPGKISTGSESTTNDIVNLDKMPKWIGEQYLPQRSAWVCCDDCFKWRRIPAALADSIEATNRRWICKDNMDKGFADCSIPQEKSNADINAELEISDVSCEEDASGARLNSKRLEPRNSTVHQQSWMLIKSNLFLHRNRKKQTIDEIMVCHCKSHPDGRMGCGDGCLNRMLNIECVKGTCPCRERCSNQQFQKHKYAKLSWFPCGKKGYGLRLLEDISEGQFLIEYVGEVLDMHAYEARQREYAAMGHKHFYFMTLNGSEVIDACAKGNLGRFINHSCDPNCRTEKWMVNGEVCIGLFAIRDIKKDEEVTFDYNYVRVFGAAAKKCVCGSSQCRGIIGGDPLNTEVIVQGDSDEEYPEPVMLYEDRHIDESLKTVISATSSFYSANMQMADSRSGNKDKKDKSATAVAHLESTTELQTAGVLNKNKLENERIATLVQHLEITPEKSLNERASGAQLALSLKIDSSGEKFQPVRQAATSAQLDDISDNTISDVQQEFVQSLETSAVTESSSKQLSGMMSNKKKFKSDPVEERRDPKSRLLMNTSRSSPSVKKGKVKSNTPKVDKSELMSNKSHALPFKPRKTLEGPLNGRFEAVEGKLNELLDADGGISKRKDAAKGYLKLLLLTATSGDSGNGEAIQSNRDLSMILDGLLKTKSRMVLVDIINKNGLQMLHNIMKRYRREFNKIPILRKLLKILEYLAVREILTLEHINGGPPCPGVESFRESILTLTDHDDKQVHQIARNFRDRWIPKPPRRSSCMDRSDGRVEFLRDSNCNRYSASPNHGHDQVLKSPEVINSTKQSSVATNSVDASTQGSCSISGSNGCSTNGTKTRKRKSRWDQPASPPKEQKIQPSLLQNSHSVPQPELGKVVSDHKNGISSEENKADDGGQNIDNDVPDVPPGFSPSDVPSVSSSASPTVTEIHQGSGFRSKLSSEVVMGHPNGRFDNSLAVSFGIPLPLAQQFGVPQAETLENWIVAPGMPFHPFPPLPSYPRDKRQPPPCAGNSEQNPPSTSGARVPDVDQRANNQNYFQRSRGEHSLGRRFFRKQKWNNPHARPPWNPKRNGWGFMGNNSRNGMCNVGPNSSEHVNTGAESTCNTFHQYRQQQNFH